MEGIPGMNTLPNLTIASAALALTIALAGNARAADDTPVRISFDRASARTDIVTGRTLPDYTQAVRGSIRFYNGRLDTPEEGFWYYFDGRRFQPIERTLFIRKLKYIGTWVIAGTSRWGEAAQEGGPVPTAHSNTNCEIFHHAISFVPLNPRTGKPDDRVYVLVEDLELIQWQPYNHWLVTVSQEELEARHGRVY